MANRKQLTKCGVKPAEHNPDCPLCNRSKMNARQIAGELYYELYRLRQKDWFKKN